MEIFKKSITQKEFIIKFLILGLLTVPVSYIAYTANYSILSIDLAPEIIHGLVQIIQGALFLIGLSFIGARFANFGGNRLVGQLLGAGVYFISKVIGFAIYGAILNPFIAIILDILLFVLLFGICFGLKKTKIISDKTINL